MQNEKNKMMRSVLVPVRVVWNPEDAEEFIGENRPETERQIRVDGKFIVIIGSKVKIICEVGIELNEKKKFFGKDYEIARDPNDGSYSVLFTERTSVERLTSDKSSVGIGRPKIDEELSIFVASIMKGMNPLVGFDKTIKGDVKLLADRGNIIRVLVELLDAVWVVSVMRTYTAEEIAVDVGELKVMPKSIALTKDILAALVYHLIPRTSR